MAAWRTSRRDDVDRPVGLPDLQLVEMRPQTIGHRRQRHRRSDPLRRLAGPDELFGRSKIGVAEGREADPRQQRHLKSPPQGVLPIERQGGHPQRWCRQQRRRGSIDRLHRPGRQAHLQAVLPVADPVGHPPRGGRRCRTPATAPARGWWSRHGVPRRSCDRLTRRSRRGCTPASGRNTSPSRATARASRPTRPGPGRAVGGTPGNRHATRCSWSAIGSHFGPIGFVGQAMSIDGRHWCRSGQRLFIPAPIIRDFDQLGVGIRSPIRPVGA